MMEKIEAQVGPSGETQDPIYRVPTLATMQDADGNDVVVVVGHAEYNRKRIESQIASLQELLAQMDEVDKGVKDKKVA